ncbi:hypothetical protein [Ottowia sp. SB7-C50]|jgi:hypothetical protein|nr:hypothetical protein [Ottowia sp. SB7-C50]WOP16390.1 hypothetical protein R0D99_05015 [Ottowia sp. SB7-C50]
MTDSKTFERKERRGLAKDAEKKNLKVFFANFAQPLRPLRSVFWGA